ncbi:MAG: NAD(P)H-dependent oxidoreductase subunit E [Treponema sp.]|jgi:NADH-quinone oxidoreductase subunit F|nr:NAD(P)H-dependent oxidoreductase subunit E [Treponema sp.]
MDKLILVCCGTGCAANGAFDILKTFEEEIKKTGAAAGLMPKIKETGCHGLCEEGPVVKILPDDVSYYRVKTADVPEILAGIASGGVVERLLGKDNEGRSVRSEKEHPFYARQMRIALRNTGRIEPWSVEDYTNRDGYRALGKALTMDPEKIIDEVEKSGIRGRGGAGFPTGRKWRQCAGFPEQPRYVVCNGDEGDPGAFMDGAVLEGDPHSVIEGLCIAALAVGASEGFMYIRDEYDQALRSMFKALEAARKSGYLGRNILGSGRDFDISVVRGGGAFVCGESSALMASIEGRVGEPRTKYIRSVQRGLWDKPTVLNNVETLANIPYIILHGGDHFKSVGVETSSGTKVFSLVGKIRRTGLVEVPMGTILRELIFDIGGGIPGGREFKAVQTGGPSGGCIPASLLDLKLDFDSLNKYGSMMGSGGIIVMDDRTCMVEVARYYTNFLTEESCGKCTPCREGLRHMLRILTGLTTGRGREGDIELLEEIGETMQGASLCGLGKSAPNPVLSTIKYFRSEYEAHIRDKICPAGICPSLTRFMINESACKSCGQCAKACPVSAIVMDGSRPPDSAGASGRKGGPYRINSAVCISCGSCRRACKFDAVYTEGRQSVCRV